MLRVASVVVILLVLGGLPAGALAQPALVEPQPAADGGADAGIPADVVSPIDAGAVSDVAPEVVPAAPIAADASAPPSSGSDADRAIDPEPVADDAEPSALESVAESLQIHGFVSQGYILTIENDYLAHSTDGGSFEMTEVGLNLTVEPIDRLRLGVQLFSRDLGPIGNYEIRADWFYVDYRFADWLGIRVGRTKIPFGLYNELNDVDAARVPILMPQSVYPITNRDFLLAQTGAEIYGRIPLGGGGALEYRLYGGTIFVELPDDQSASVQIRSLEVPYLVGGRILWEAPIPGLRMGGSVQVARLNTEIVLGPMSLDLDIAPAVLWMASAEYTNGDLHLAAEYGRTHTRIESSDPMVYPSGSSVSEQAYAMASYQIAPWLHPGLYYALLFRDVDDRHGREAQQHDVALTVRFDINEYWLVKLEGHYMRGTAGLDDDLNDGTPASMLAWDWAVFLIKTTGYF